MNVMSIWSSGVGRLRVAGWNRGNRDRDERHEREWVWVRASAGCTYSNSYSGIYTYTSVQAITTARHVLQRYIYVRTINDRSVIQYRSLSYDTFLRIVVTVCTYCTSSTSTEQAARKVPNRYVV